MFQFKTLKSSTKWPQAGKGSCLGYETLDWVTTFGSPLGIDECSTLGIQNGLKITQFLYATDIYDLQSSVSAPLRTVLQDGAVGKGTGGIANHSVPKNISGTCIKLAFDSLVVEACNGVVPGNHENAVLYVEHGLLKVYSATKKNLCVWQYCNRGCSLFTVSCDEMTDDDRIWEGPPVPQLSVLHGAAMTGTEHKHLLV